MSAGGALTFNQWWERETDPLMARTRLRPLATGAVSPKLALAWSILLSCGGLALLAVIFNMAAMGLSAAIIFVYCFIYTPMKRLTHWATEVGSVSGAIPPLLGAAAAGNVWSVPAWVLAVALLFWQMPHFFSIGWIYREDYRAAGLPLLPTLDQSGRRAALWSFGYSLCLAPALILPWALGKMGIFYAAAAIASSAAILAASWRFLRTANGDRRREARLLFRITLITLPVLMLAVVCDGR
jgi:protoheme IX farnesyltransferase